MSLVRAFTTKRRAAKADLDRAGSQPQKGTLTKGKISGPVALLSTTNQLAYEAPDIAGTQPIAYDGAAPMLMSQPSFSSAEESDGSSIGYHSGGTFTDASSVDESPISPEPNHLSCYFKPSVYDESPHSRKNSVNSVRRPSTSDAPSIPSRAPSHSKRAHVHVARQRSISRLNTPTFPEDSSLTRDSSDFFRASGPSSPHPFGKELEQLSEVAEEFGTVVRDVEADADRVFMEAHGLDRFDASDYMMEIQEMLSSVFEEEPVAYEEAGWI